MAIGYHLAEFNGKPVEQYDPAVGIETPESVCYRVGLTYDQYDVEGASIINALDSFAAHPNVSKVTELVIGLWTFEPYEEGPGEVLAKIVEIAPKMPNLTALMFGDITYEESEISWIENGNVAPIVHAFPKLLEFRVRGGNNLSLDKLAHDTLEKLVIEAGGLAATTINDAVRAKCPELKHFEIWLGVEDYGFDGSVHNLRPLLTGAVFPKLETLALRNAFITNEIAEALVTTEAADASSVVVEGSTFVLTGALNLMTRSEAKKRLEALGAKVASSVSKNTNYLIAGDKAGSKMEQAKSLGVTVLSEADMMKLLGESADNVSSGTASILDRIKVLDLSMGTLTDRGAEALYNNPKILQLDKLDLHSHYMSDEWVAKFKALDLDVDVSDQQEIEDEDWIYPSVTE